jgi:hypothetical protein
MQQTLRRKRGTPAPRRSRRRRGKTTAGRPVPRVIDDAGVKGIKYATRHRKRGARVRVGVATAGAAPCAHSTCVLDSNSVLASNGLNAQDLADSVAVGRVVELIEQSIQNWKNSLNLARFWWDEGLAERVGFEPTDPLACL